MIALVTGASRGIGRATALRLARDGHAVAVNFVQNQEAAEVVAAEIRAAGGDAVLAPGDTGDAAAVDAMFGRIEEAFGPVEILVNNAGILRRGSIDSYDAAAMAEMVRVNMEGVIHCTRRAASRMREVGGGRIVNLSSVAARGTAAMGTTWYAATKGAVETLTRRFAFELGGAGIRVNAVAPGFILTDMVDAANREAILATMSSKAVLGRVGTPEEIADVIAFLVSNDSRFLTGQVLTVDGGRIDFLTH